MDVDEQVAEADDRLLHVWAESDAIDYQKRGRAKAEIEQRRREWEERRAAARREFEIRLSEDAHAREASRRNFDDALAKRQIAHATELAEKQETNARTVASATKLAAWAAAFSAIGAIVSAIAAVVGLFHPWQSLAH